MHREVAGRPGGFVAVNIESTSRASHTIPRFLESRRHFLLASPLILLAVGPPVLLAVVSDSLGIPHNDAWSHARIAQTFARSGGVELVGWNRTALMGQIIPLGPLAGSLAIQNLFSAFCAAVGLASAWLVVRRRTSPGFASLVVAVVAVTPDFGLLATSFMSDVPAFAGMMACIALADRATETGRWAWAVAAVAVGTWAFMVREQALVALVVVAALLLRSRAWEVAASRTLLGTSAAALVCFELWRRGLPNGDPLQVDFSIMSVAYDGVDACYTIALYLLPVILRGLLELRSRAALGATLLSIGGLVLAERLDWRVLLGNYFSASGAYGGAAPLDRHVFPQWVVVAATVVAALALGPAAALLVKNVRRTDSSLWWYLALFTGGTAAQSLLGQSIFARYLLPALPVLAICMYRSGESHDTTRARTAAPLPVGIALCLAGLVSISVTSNALAYDGARWALATELAHRGVPADRIDAGMEWVGFHSPHVARPDAAPSPGVPSYVTMMHSSICAVVTGEQRDDRASAMIHYRKYAVAGEATLFAYVDSPCLP